MRERLARPTADEFLAAFDGQIYALGKPSAELTRSWGSSGSPPNSVGLWFRVGTTNVGVEVRHPDEWRLDRTLILLVSDFASVRTPRFPVTIERGRTILKVEGRRRAFVTYTCGARAIARATVGDLDVEIRGPRSFLPKVELVRIDPQDLKWALSESER